MSLLEELHTIITALSIPVETGVFTGEPPDTYAVLTPLGDTFALNADDCPGVDVQEVRISLFTKTNPRQSLKKLIRALLRADITITSRAYIEYEPGTLYHHNEVDVAQQYPWDNNEEE
jgi:hypothetical protein